MMFIIPLPWLSFIIISSRCKSAWEDSNLFQCIQFLVNTQWSTLAGTFKSYFVAGSVISIRMAFPDIFLK